MDWRILTLIVSTLWVGHATAQQPHAPKNFWLSPWYCPSLGCCPDDYCRKPCPGIIPIPRCGSLDDYCRKPMPNLTDVPHCGSCDDYCRKPLPTLLCPPLTPFLRCGPSCVPALGR